VHIRITDSFPIEHQSPFRASSNHGQRKRNCAFARLIQSDVDLKTILTTYDAQVYVSTSGYKNDLHPNGLETGLN
jgi:hypothetical protein